MQCWLSMLPATLNFLWKLKHSLANKERTLEWDKQRVRREVVGPIRLKGKKEKLLPTFGRIINSTSQLSRLIFGIICAFFGNEKLNDIKHTVHNIQYCAFVLWARGVKIKINMQKAPQTFGKQNREGSRSRNGMPEMANEKWRMEKWTK